VANNDEPKVIAAPGDCIGIIAESKIQFCAFLGKPGPVTHNPTVYCKLRLFRLLLFTEMV
jgi:hypothetical protein